MADSPTDLGSFLEGVEKHREAIFNMPRALSQKLGLPYDTLMEVQLHYGVSLIMTTGRFIGTIDDGSKLITDFSKGSAVDRAAFDSVYTPLTTNGYEMKRMPNYLNGGDLEVANLLVSSGIAKKLSDALEGREFLDHIHVVMENCDRHYDEQGIMGSAGDLAAIIGGEAGGLAKALALSAQVKANGGQILQVPPASKTNLEARSVRQIDASPVLAEAPAAAPSEAAP